MTPYLQMLNITKTFGKLVANDRINFNVNRGEIHALLGENGAGKSTLMNILYGLYQPVSGEIILNNKQVEINSPLDAINMGIGMVHQHFMLIPALTVLENVIVGLPSAKKPFLDLKKAEQKLQELAGKHNLKINPGVRVSQLPVGIQQQIEVLKALYRGAELLILDEPTGVLTPQETKELFHTLRSLAHDGKSIIFITHKLNEVMEISHRVTVLRQGKVIGTVNTSETSTEELARMMVGRDVLCTERSSKKHETGEEVVLKVDGVVAVNDRRITALKGISFTLKKGEIVGIAGVDGNGQSELAEVVTGLRPVQRGKVIVNGRDLTNSSPASYIEEKVGYIPEDRKQTGSIKGFTLAETAVMKNHPQAPYSRYMLLQNQEIHSYSEKLVDDYDIRTQSIHLTAHLLSGGNLQKLILARELSNDPRLLIAMHPTRGLDVGAIEFIHKQLLHASEKGTAILLISTELDEILLLADRILVLYEGEIMGSFAAGEYDVERIGLMMAGVKEPVSDYREGA